MKRRVKAGRGVAVSLLCWAIFSLAACSSSGFNLKALAKSEIDAVADAHRNESERLLNELLVKLYKRNPRELRKTPGVTLTGRQLSLFGRPDSPADARQAAPLDELRLALESGYRGDRVYMLMHGLSGMISQAYNNKREFFMLDQLDAQKLYNSARNIEVLLWRLRTQRDANGEPLLLTNSRPGESYNLSFERTFGKLIQLQDMMATITAGRTQRTINQVTKSVASMAFMPI